MIKMVEILGCGGAFAPELGNSSFILWMDANKKQGILFDCGGDVFSKLRTLGYLYAIDSVVISHLHGDHAGSLDTLIYWNYFALGRKLYVYSLGDMHLNYLHVIDKKLINYTLSGVLGVEILLQEASHCEGMLCSYATFDKEILISGDVNLPIVADKKLVLHEVCFGQSLPLSPKYEGMVHTHFECLLDAVPSAIRSSYWLYHYNTGDYEAHSKVVVDAGFAGLVVPGQIIEIK
jgi:flavorubredoxin